MLNCPSTIQKWNYASRCDRRSVEVQAFHLIFLALFCKFDWFLCAVFIHVTLDWTIVWFLFNKKVFSMTLSADDVDVFWHKLWISIVRTYCDYYVWLTASLFCFPTWILQFLFWIYRYYVQHRTLTSMNFDNPVYRKTTEDQFSLEKNLPSRVYPSTIDDEVIDWTSPNWLYRKILISNWEQFASISDSRTTKQRTDQWFCVKSRERISLPIEHIQHIYYYPWISTESHDTTQRISFAPFIFKI